MYTMEVGMMNRQSCGIPNTKTKSPSSSSPLGMHKNSQMISKVKPKIRIIHIFAPEIIKTDVCNFRELVQRLTGKPSPEDSATTKKRPRVPRIRSSVQEDEQIASPRLSNGRPAVAKKLEIRTGFRPSEFRERIKGEEEIWGSANSGGGFLGGFADMDGFMQELTGFPLLPLDADAFGESQVA